MQQASFRVTIALIAIALAASAGLSILWRDARQADQVARALVGGDPANAPLLMRRYGCAGCHTIPGIPGADGQVAASLSGLRKRIYLGGVALNTPENIIAWIVSPQRFSTHTAMPTTGISEDEARDVATYLYAQD